MFLPNCPVAVRLLPRFAQFVPAWALAPVQPALLFGCPATQRTRVDTVSNNNEKRNEGAVSSEIAHQVRAALANLLIGATPVPPVLEGLPIELWLERIVPVAVAAELLCLTPETVLNKYRPQLIQLDGRKYGMRLRDALKLEPKGGGTSAMHNDSFDSRPLAPPTPVGEQAVSLRPGALRCVRCMQVFHQHDAQAFGDGLRFVCSGCGLDALEVAPA